MKTSTKTSYLKCIDRVVGFLSDQVDADPSLEALADVAAISPYHFHRVYRAMTGETPSSTLRRLRLAKACFLMKDPAKTITEIAFEVGYDSSQAFARAFRVAVGKTPREVRKNSDSMSKVLKDLSSAPGGPEVSPANIEVKMTSMEPITVIAARHLGPHKGLFRAYSGFFAFAEKAGWVGSFRGIYGIPIDDPRDVPEAECRFDCCFQFGPEVRGKGPYQARTLGGGDYAVLRHIGHYDGLEEKYHFLYGPWLRETGLILRDAPVFNHYLQDPDSRPPEEWETDIYLPVTKGDKP
jgi:AraC family transcriptional regulator